MTTENGCAEVALAVMQPELPSLFTMVNYDELNARQKENFNFQKVSARLADYGYNCLRLSDDWNGADFIACHNSGIKFLKVQLKGRLTIQKKYEHKNIYIAYCNNGLWYLFTHDEMMNALLSKKLMVGTKAWDEKGGYSWGRPSVQIKEMLIKYLI